MSQACLQESVKFGADDAQTVRVLIAEDDPRVRAALRSLLAASPGFDVVGDTGNAATALRMARAQPPSVALVEVLLPDAPDGLALLRALTGELKIPVLAISLEGGIRDRALQAGASRFLDKGNPPELLLTTLRSVVRPDRPQP